MWLFAVHVIKFSKNWVIIEACDFGPNSSETVDRVIHSFIHSFIYSFIYLFVKNKSLTDRTGPKSDMANIPNYGTANREVVDEDQERQRA